jgi:hypothetical protein
VRGLWNDEFLRVLENFPAGQHDDEVDALSGAYENLPRNSGPFAMEVIPRQDRMSALGGCKDRWPVRRNEMMY